MPVLAPMFSPTEGAKLGSLDGALFAVGRFPEDAGKTSGTGS